MDESPSTNRWVKWFVVGFACFTVAFMAYFVLNPRPRTFEEIAYKAVILPPGATVLYAKEGDWAGDVEVTFRLPKRQLPEAHLKEMWKMNSFPAATTTAKYQRDWSKGGASKVLSYDLVSKTYRYECTLEK